MEKEAELEEQLAATRESLTAALAQEELEAAAAENSIATIYKGLKTPLTLHKKI